jgi:uncharacterized membrane protein
MRNVSSPLGTFALVLTGAVVLACGGGDSAGRMDSSAAAAAAPPPPAESFAIMAKDGSWSADITPASIVWRGRKGGKMDSLTFEYKAPQVDGAITKFEIVRTSPDTHTFAAQLAMTPCTDSKNAQYTHLAQIWVDQVAYSGCATKK